MSHRAWTRAVALAIGCFSLLLVAVGLFRWLLFAGMAAQPEFLFFTSVGFGAGGVAAMSLLLFPSLLSITIRRVGPSGEEWPSETFDDLDKACRIGGVGCFSCRLASGEWVGAGAVHESLGLRGQGPHKLRQLLALLDPVERRRLKRGFISVVRNSGVVDQTLRVVRSKDAEERSIRLRFKVQCDRRGKPSKLIGSVQDVTDCVRLQETLCRQEQQSRTVMDAAPVAMLLVDDQGLIQTANAACAEVFGYVPADMVLRPIESLIPERFRPGHERLRQAYLQAPRARPMAGRDLAGLRKDGREFPVQIGIAPVEGAVPSQIVVSLVDRTDRKKMEQALLEREAIFKSIVDQALDGIALVDVETGAFLEFNAAAHRSLGYTREAMARLTIMDVEALETPQETFDHLARMAAGGGDIFETKLRRRDGEVLDMRVSTQAIQVGKRPCVACIWSDITERNRIEQTLRGHVMDLQLAQEMGRIGNWTLDPAVGVPEWSDLIYEIYERDPRLGPPHIDEYRSIYQADQHNLFREALRSAVEDGRGYQLTLRLDLPNGVRKWVETNCQTSKKKEGDGYCLRGTIQDITERIQNAERLKELNERMRLATSLAGIGTWEYDLVADRTIWSDEMYTIYGVSASDFGNKFSDWERRLHPDDRAGMIEKYQRMLSDDVELNTEFRIIRPDGTERAIAVRGKMFRAADGTPSRLIGSNLDVTEYRNALARAEAARELAEAANLAKSRFLATMSHELRTPLNAVLGFAEILASSETDALRRQHLKIISEAGSTLLNLIQDILDLSRIEAGKVELRNEPFDLCHETGAAVDVFRAKAEKKGLSLALSLAPTVPRQLIGDAGVLRQILFNLVGNAIKFTERGRVDITVNVEERGPAAVCLRVVVADTGIGIRPEHQQRIFRTFEQEDETLGRRFGGAGLGLAIARQLVARLGGSIGLESQVGQGSRFTFTAMLKRLESAAAAPEPVDAGAEDGIARRDTAVLVVEDDLFSRELIKYILAEAEYVVTAVSDGRRAIQALESQAYELILMDIQMPEIDGLQLIEMIRRGDVSGCDPSVPIIAVTAHALRGDAERFQAAGASDYVSKPLNASALLSKVRAQLA